jgi:hypothetical protein
VIGQASVVRDRQITACAMTWPQSEDKAKLQDNWSLGCNAYFLIHSVRTNYFFLTWFNFAYLATLSIT